MIYPWCNHVMVERSTAITLTWVFILVYCLTFLPFQFYVPTANTYIYSYQLGDVPGTLVSQRWTYSFVVSCMFSLLWFVPITLAFALTSTTRSTWPQKLHYVFTGTFLVWVAFSFLFGCIDWGHSNNPGIENAYNQANDDHWCGAYYSLRPPCANTVGFTPAVSPSMFSTNGLFLMQLWYSFVLMAFLIFDLIFVGCVIFPPICQEEGVEGISPGDPAELQIVSISRPLYRPRRK